MEYVKVVWKKSMFYPFSQRENVIAFILLGHIVLCVLYGFTWLHMVHLGISELQHSNFVP